MKAKIVKTLISLAMAVAIISLLDSCKAKKVAVPEVVSVPAKVLTTPEISLGTLFKNDSLVFIDTNRVMVVIKRDTVAKTIQVRAKCPEEKVILKPQIVEKEVVKYRINWFAIAFAAIATAAFTAYYLRSSR
ncbi:MAG: hypothetical protein QXT25_03255 [Candidatus Anstonellaceae archaeon]